MINYCLNARGNQNRVTRFQHQLAYLLDNCTECEITKLAYEPKKIEYNQYYGIYYPLDPNRHINNEEYAYGFVCYNAHREKSKTRNACTITSRFYLNDYLQVWKFIIQYSAL